MTKYIYILIFLGSTANAGNTQTDFSKYLNEFKSLASSSLAKVKSFDEKKELPKYTETPNESRYYKQGDKDRLSKEAKSRMEREDAAGTAAVEELTKRDSVDLNVAEVKKAAQSQSSSGKVVDESNIECRGEECLKIEPQANDEFEDVLTKASSATTAGDDYSQSKNGKNKGADESTIKMFSGRPMTCKKRPIGYLDCCSDKGWGKDLNLAKCAAEDKALGKAKLNYIAHYLGEYCAKWIKWPGGKTCKERRRTYCVFSSKMARIIHEEGRLRHNSGALGNAEHPRCYGLTAKQFEAINVKDIDFINPIYPWKGGRGPHNRKAGVAGDIALNSPNNAAYKKKLEECRKNHKENGICAL